LENLEDQKHIIERIKLLREAHGWVLGRFSTRLGMRMDLYRAIEEGRVIISESQLEKMAEVLCVDVKKLGSAEPQDIADMLADNIKRHRTRPMVPYNKSQPTIFDFEKENKKLRAMIEKKDNKIARLEKKIVDLTRLFTRKI